MPNFTNFHSIWCAIRFSFSRFSKNCTLIAPFTLLHFPHLLNLCYDVQDWNYIYNHTDMQRRRRWKHNAAIDALAFLMACFSFETKNPLLAHTECTEHENWKRTEENKKTLYSLQNILKQIKVTKKHDGKAWKFNQATLKEKQPRKTNNKNNRGKNHCCSFCYRIRESYVIFICDTVKVITLSSIVLKGRTLYGVWCTLLLGSRKTRTKMQRTHRDEAKTK